ncbi:cytochrome P450 [Nonlabens sp. SCSIO 43208]|uniref:cytochrome P450 n=1 Tax=Nonlabens sp. SCSIO 43208 TaxID=2793009 RepID=UPI003D6A152F
MEIPQVPFIEFFSKSRQIYKDPLPFHRYNFKKYGKTFKIKPKSGLVIHFTCDEDLAQYMLQKNQKNFHKSTLQTKDLGKYIGHGLLTANGEQWKANRKLIQPAFYKKSIATLMNKMEEVVDKELGNIKPNETQDVFEIFNNLAFKVVAKTLFYIEDIDDKINRLQEITEKAQKMLIKELRLPFLLWYYKREWLSGSGSIPYHLELINEARQLLSDIIDDRKTSQKHFGDLLDMLLHSTYEDGSYMSKEQLIDEILVLFIAGHETTANALSFATELLAQHQNAQDLVLQSLQDVDKESDLMTQIMRSQFTKQCVEETLRLYPPAYVTDRVALKDDECGSIKIDKNTNWLISFYELHRREDLWESPDDFKPERFNPDRVKEYRNFYFPFGAGPRMCVGNNFAMFEMIMVLNKLVSKYHLVPTRERIEYNPLITLKPKKAMVMFKER